MFKLNMYMLYEISKETNQDIIKDWATSWVFEEESLCKNFISFEDIEVGF